MKTIKNFIYTLFWISVALLAVKAYRYDWEHMRQPENPIQITQTFSQENDSEESRRENDSEEPQLEEEEEDEDTQQVLSSSNNNIIHIKSDKIIPILANIKGTKKYYLVSDPNDPTKLHYCEKVKSNTYRPIPGVEYTKKVWEDNDKTPSHYDSPDNGSYSKEAIESATRKWINRYRKSGTKAMNEDNISLYYGGGAQSVSKAPQPYSEVVEFHNRYMIKTNTLFSHDEEIDVPGIEERTNYYERSINMLNDVKEDMDNYQGLAATENNYRKTIIDDDWDLNYNQLAKEAVIAWHRSKSGHRQAQQNGIYDMAAIEAHGVTYKVYTGSDTLKVGVLYVSMMYCIDNYKDYKSVLDSIKKHDPMRYEWCKDLAI